VSIILAISAHPDDETMFIGGALAMYSAAGHDVYVLETTRGEGGEVGDPPLASRSTVGAVREAEARAACAALGVREVIFLPFADPYMEIDGAAQHIDAPLEGFAGAIGDALAQLQPDLVLTHGSNGEYGHPQHIYTHRAAQLALASVARPIALATWCAWYEGAERERMLNRDDPADAILDIIPWLPAKLAAAECHRTQHSMFRRNNRGVEQIADMLLRVESLRLWRGALPEAGEVGHGAA
jgi:LmbE family N-acetylglucosaminyl deacetylase